MSLYILMFSVFSSPSTTSWHVTFSQLCWVRQVVVDRTLRHAHGEELKGMSYYRGFSFSINCNGTKPVGNIYVIKFMKACKIWLFLGKQSARPVKLTEQITAQRQANRFVCCRWSKLYIFSQFWKHWIGCKCIRMNLTQSITDHSFLCRMMLFKWSQVFFHINTQRKNNVILRWNDVSIQYYASQMCVWWVSFTKSRSFCSRVLRVDKGDVICLKQKYKSAFIILMTDHI